MKASAINTVGITVAVSGILVSWIIYQTSIPQPPPTDPVERALTQPYHSVEAGDYHKSQYWWYEENDDDDGDSNSGSSSLNGTHSHDVALVTGANTGIGKAIAIGLCQMGVGTVVITSRSLRRAQDAVDDMISSGACTVGQVDAMAVDLADFKSVRTLATMFRSKYDRLNYFVENAGGIILPIGGYKGPHMTEDGFEYLYAGNYLGHFLLLNLLIDLVETSTPSRISITSSIAHWGADIHNLSSLLPTGRRARTSQEGDGIISGFEQYCNTKFLQIAMAFELQARLGSESNVTVIPVAPGLVSTNIPSADRNKQMAGNPLAMTPTEGAKTTLHALFSPTVEKTQGYFLQPYWSPLHQNRPIGPLGISLLPWEWMFQRLSWGPHLWLSHPDTHRREFQKQLWDESYAAVGL
jgi:NAD(P)-dependent dehydrogenase (short-subunit alcohol dehydrogenase family)